VRNGTSVKTAAVTAQSGAERLLVNRLAQRTEEFRERLAGSTDELGRQGAEAVHAMLVLKRDDSMRFAYFFRVEQVSRDSGRTWGDELSLMEPGASGEVSFRRTD
jgi:hypothetical protein